MTTITKMPEMNSVLEQILGLQCFQLAGPARFLRLGGTPIAHKAESEQAAMLHFFLNCYLEAGDGWNKLATDRLHAMQPTPSEITNFIDVRRRDSGWIVYDVIMKSADGVHAHRYAVCGENQPIQDARFFINHHQANDFMALIIKDLDIDGEINPETLKVVPSYSEKEMLGLIIQEFNKNAGEQKADHQQAEQGEQP